MSSHTSTLIGLVGDYDAGVTAHQAIPRALALAAGALGAPLEFRWLPTETIDERRRAGAVRRALVRAGQPVSQHGGRAAGDPLRARAARSRSSAPAAASSTRSWNMRATSWAGPTPSTRRRRPTPPRPVIAPLACSLVEVTDKVQLRPGSRIAAAYGATEATEGYHCRYGLNEAFRATLVSGALRVTAEDEAGDIRALELEGHPFFVATLFQPERAALTGRLPPLVAAFARAAVEQAAALPERMPAPAD